ncbi:hypothetical protein BZA70DRAFT_115796 [Myxozyma melibiosi]|uniref:Zn(2)-C6 fungal-type domain-containing protein n=1 Tax=Myxozyma melibiosi TaxID=54550 RepID=A0ABR1FAR5_9ASCO
MLPYGQSKSPYALSSLIHPPDSSQQPELPNNLPAVRSLSAAVSAQQRAVEQPAAAVADEHKRSRACDNCRALKVRCVPHDESDASGACHRCFKSARKCVFTVNPRKRQKRTDTRVADLEKKLDELTQRLSAAREEGESVGSPDSADGSSRATGAGSLIASSAHASEPISRLSPSTPQPGSRLYYHPSNGSTSTSPPAPDPVAQPQSRAKSDEYRSMSSLAELAALKSHGASAFQNSFHAFFGRPAPEASNLPVVDPAHIRNILTKYGLCDGYAQGVLEYFVKTVLPCGSLVYFDPDTKFEDLIQTKPLVTLSICSIGSTKNGAKGRNEIASSLMSELYKIVSEQVLIVGTKSVDLIQALLILTFWYSPPELFEARKIHVFTACAVAISSDMGIGQPSRHRRKLFEKPYDQKSPDPKMELTSLEHRRLWIAVYLSASCYSMLFRQMTLLQWSPYLQECCDVLENQTEGRTYFDQVLCSLARLHSIADEINLMFHPADFAESVDINDRRTTNLMRMFERHLAAWKAKSPDDPFLLISYYSTQIFMHEIGLHNKTNRSDFVIPFTETSLNPDAPIVTPLHVESISWCISSCQSLIDIFCTCDLTRLSYAPVHIIGRVIYACTILLKISIMILRVDRMSSVCSISMVRPEYYLGRVYQQISLLCSDGPFSLVALKFKYVLGHLYMWFHRVNRGAWRKSSQGGNPENSRSKPSHRAPKATTSQTRNDTDKPELFSGMTEYDAASSNPAFDENHVSTLDMLSSVAVREAGQNQNSSESPHTTTAPSNQPPARARAPVNAPLADKTNTPSSYTPEEEIRMADSGLTIYEHIFQEFMGGASDDTGLKPEDYNPTLPNYAAGDPNRQNSTQLPPEAYFGKQDMADLNAYDYLSADTGAFSMSHFMDDYFWKDLYFINNGQAPDPVVSSAPET